MFEFVKQIFISAMFFGCNLPSVNSLKYISMNNQEGKDHKLLILIVKKLYFCLLVLKQVNAVVVAIISMIQINAYVNAKNWLIKVYVTKDLFWI